MDNSNIAKYKITADILSFEKGTEHYENVRAIRLDSDGYSLRIMSDYLPMIGELKGDMTILFADSEIVYENIRGFYRHAHNNFEFIIKDRINARTGNT